MSIRILAEPAPESPFLTLPARESDLEVLYLLP
jgi:hypothetical protein